MERDALSGDKTRAEGDVATLERRLHEVLHKLEQDVRSQHDFQSAPHPDTPQVKQVRLSLSSLWSGR